MNRLHIEDTMRLQKEILQLTASCERNLREILILDNTDSSHVQMVDALSTASKIKPHTIPENLKEVITKELNGDISMDQDESNYNIGLENMMNNQIENAKILKT